jgi:hypothetical protein
MELILQKVIILLNRSPFKSTVSISTSLITRF